MKRRPKLLPEFSCPHCGEIHSRSTAVMRQRNKPKPVPGDISICIACAGLCLFDDDMSLVKMPRGVLESLGVTERWEVLRGQQAILQLKKL